MREIRFCADCNRLQQLTVNGRCDRCNSDAIAPARAFRCKDAAEIELERIYELVPAESGGRFR